MDLKTISVLVGVVAGVVVAATSFSLVKRFRSRDPQKVWDEVTYSNLISFANICKGKFSEIVKSKVICDKQKDGLYQVTQIMLDKNMTAVRSLGGDIVGRIFKCKKLDEKIIVLCRNEILGDFDFVV